jgi:hypothetical protein
VLQTYRKKSEKAIDSQKTKPLFPGDQATRQMSVRRNTCIIPDFKPKRHISAGRGINFRSGENV